MNRTRKLTDQQKLFIAKYNEHLNATEAAREAGYANPGPRGCKLLKDRRIATLIAETVAAKIEKAGLSAERVLEEIRRLAFFDIRRLYDASGKLKAIKDLSDDEAAALVSIDMVREHANAGDDHLETVIRVRLHDKIRALDMLAKPFRPSQRARRADVRRTHPRRVHGCSVDRRSTQPNTRRGHPLAHATI